MEIKRLHRRFYAGLTGILVTIFILLFFSFFTRRNIRFSASVTGNKVENGFFLYQSSLKEKDTGRISFLMNEENREFQYTLPLRKSQYIAFQFYGKSPGYQIHIEEIKDQISFIDIFNLNNTDNSYIPVGDCHNCKLSFELDKTYITPELNGNYPVLILESHNTGILASVLRIPTPLILISLLIGVLAYLASWFPLKTLHTNLTIIDTFSGYIKLRFPGIDLRLFYITAITVLLFIIFVSLKLNGSSVSKWNGLIPRDHTVTTDEIGNSRTIRSDEYLVSTPFILSQHYYGYPEVNPALGPGKVTLATTYNLPVADIFAFFIPSNYGFFVFEDVETAFSWRWNFATFGLFLTTFFVAYILTNKRLGISLFAGVWMLYSGAIQWWFYIYPHQILTMNALFLGSILFISSKRKWVIFISAVILLIFSFQFVYILYPPTQIMLGYLLLILLISFLISPHNQFVSIFENNNMFRTIVGFSLMIVFLAVLGYYISEIYDSAKQIMNTEYPGKRVIHGGNRPLYTFFTGIFDRYYTFSFPDKIYANQSEASSYILLFPFLIPFIWNWIKRKDWILVGLMVYSILLILQETTGLPDIITTPLLLDKVHRNILGVGVAGIYGSVIFLSQVNLQSRKEVKLSVKNLSVSVLVIGTYLILIWKMTEADPSFFKSSRILYGVIISVILFFSLIYKKQRVFIFSILAILLPIVTVNPIRKGLSPLTDSSVNKSIIDAAALSPGEKTSGFVVYENNVISFYLMANGYNVINGVKYIPDWLTLNFFDRENKYRKISNRYARIDFLPAEDSNISFKLNHADNYTIHISPCNEAFRDANVEFLIIPIFAEHDYNKYQCLNSNTLVYADYTRGFQIYRVEN